MINSDKVIYNNKGLNKKIPIKICGILYYPQSKPKIVSAGTKRLNTNTNTNTNYGENYEFPVNYPSVSEMQASCGTIATNLGPIPF